MFRSEWYSAKWGSDGEYRSPMSMLSDLWDAEIATIIGGEASVIPEEIVHELHATPNKAFYDGIMFAYDALDAVAYSVFGANSTAISEYRTWMAARRDEVLQYDPTKTEGKTIAQLIPMWPQDEIAERAIDEILNAFAQDECSQRAMQQGLIATLDLGLDALCVVYEDLHKDGAIDEVVRYVYKHDLVGVLTSIDNDLRDFLHTHEIDITDMTQLSDVHVEMISQFLERWYEEKSIGSLGAIAVKGSVEVTGIYTDNFTIHPTGLLENEQSISGILTSFILGCTDSTPPGIHMVIADDVEVGLSWLVGLGQKGLRVDRPPDYNR